MQNEFPLFTFSGLLIRGTMKSQKGGDKVKSEYIEPEQLDFLLDLMKEANANAVRVSLETGLRIGDVLALTVQDLDAESGAICTICAKTGKPFEGKISGALSRALLSRARRGWLFPSPKTKGHRTRQAVWRDLKRAAERCALQINVTPHSARKIFAVEQFRARGLSAAQERLGHDRTETTLLYAFSDILTKNEPKKQKNAPKSAENDDKKVIQAFIEACGGEAELSRILRAFLMSL